MRFNRALAFLISMTMLAGVHPVSTLAAENAGDGITSGIMEVSDPCADGHDYEKNVTRPATETDEGEVTYTCTRCGDEYKEAIPKLEKKTDQTEEDDSKKKEDDSNKKEDDSRKEGKEKKDEKGASCKVTLPSGKGYTIKAAGDTVVESGDSFSFSVNIAEGYRKGKEFSVKAGDSTLKEGSDGTYTIKEIKKDVKVKISGVEKIEDTDEAPNDQAAEENSETTDAESGAASATDESAAPADSETVTEETPAPADSKTVTEESPAPADSKTVTEDPMNSGESSYDLYVDGIPVTADNKGDILGEDDDEGGETRKTAVYDAEKNTLTLDEAALSSERPGPAVRYEGTEELTLIFKGSCFLLGKAVQNVGDGVTSYGISASNGSLHIKAGGKGLMTISNQEAITGKDIQVMET